MAKLTQPLTQKLTAPLMQAVSGRAMIVAAGGGGPIGSDAPVTPMLFVVGAPVAFSPEMTAVANFLAGDVVEVQYKPNAGSWASDAVTTEHTITSNELGGLVWNYVIPTDLAPGDYQWRIRFKRAGGSFGAYSNEITATIPLPIPVSSFRGGSTFQAGSTTYSYNIDLGAAAADLLVIVGVLCQQDDNGTTRIIGPLKINGVTSSLTRVVNGNLDAHESVWTGLFPAGGTVSIDFTVTGTPAVPKLFWVYTLKGYNSATPKQSDVKGSNTSASIPVDVGDFVMGMGYTTNGVNSINNLSTEAFTIHRDDNGSSFTNYGSQGVAGDLIAGASRAAFLLRLENPSSPGSVQAGGKLVVAFR